MAMDTSCRIGPIAYKIARSDYGTRLSRILTASPGIVILTILWTVVAWLSERFIPYFRSELNPLGSYGWLTRTVITGFFWSILMVLWGSFSRKYPEYEIEIMPDRIIKRWHDGSGTICREDVAHLREARILSRVQGFYLTSKYYRLFVPAGHLRYAEIKRRIEDWIRAADRTFVAGDIDTARLVREERDSR